MVARRRIDVHIEGTEVKQKSLKCQKKGRKDRAWDDHSHKETGGRRLGTISAHNFGEEDIRNQYFGISAETFFDKNTDQMRKGGDSK